MSFFESYVARVRKRRAERLESEDLDKENKRTPDVIPEHTDETGTCSIDDTRKVLAAVVNQTSVVAFQPPPENVDINVVNLMNDQNTSSSNLVSDLNTSPFNQEHHECDSDFVSDHEVHPLDEELQLNGHESDSDFESDCDEGSADVAGCTEDWVKKNVFPDGYNYIGLQISENNSNYNVIVHVNITSNDEVNKWLKGIQEKTYCDYRVRRTFPNMSKARATYKEKYRCHHNTMPTSTWRTKQPHYKHVQCPFTLTILLKNVNMTRSCDPHLKSHPCLVTVKNVLHNHPIQAGDVMRHRRPSEEVKEKFRLLFKQGHSPSSALNTHKFDLQEEFGSDYIKVSGDGSKCPSLKWCFYWYKKIFNKIYGPQDGDEMMSSLKEFVAVYNEACGSECSKVLTTEDGQYMIVICTPLMKRVHTLLKASGEIVFIDASGCMDRHLSRVFTIVTPSVAGALPLGILIVSSEAEAVLKPAFDIFMSIVPDNAFYGRGQKGPTIIMTDDCSSECNVLGGLFPEAILLLRIFHVLQAVWRWILDSNHHIDKDDKPVLFQMFKDLMYCKTKEELEEKYLKLKEHPVLQKYNNAQNHFSKYMLRSAEWALCFRNEILIRGHNTNNYAEALMRVLKEIIMFRTKAFSIVQLFDFLTARIDLYSERRIIVLC